MTMKKILKTFIAIGICFGSVLLFNSTVKATEYTYPVYPGTTEWEVSAQDRAALKDTLQIPESVLSSLSTEDLINSVLNYPCFNDLYFYNSKQTGFEALKNSFNGVAELLNRSDAGVLLLSKYEQSINQIGTGDSLIKSASDEAYDKICNKSNIEVLLAQPKINEKLDKEKLDTLIVNEQESAQKLSNISSYKQNTFIQILQDQQNANNQDKESKASVLTPNGTSVLVMYRGENLSSIDKYYMNKEVVETFPGVSVLGEATSLYNCHSYAWYYASTSNTYWMNNPSAYMTDGSYHVVSNRANNDRVWFPDVHTALVTNQGAVNDMTSKWGDYPLVRHGLTNNPYYLAPLNIKIYRR